MKTKTLYIKKGLFKSTKITSTNDSIVFEENVYGNRCLFSFHSSKLKSINTFSRIYHIGLIVTSTFLGGLSIMLLVKDWGSGRWTLYLSIVPLIIICLGYIYYFLHGIKYGEVELNIDGFKKYLYLTEQEYNDLRMQIDEINKLQK